MVTHEQLKQKHHEQLKQKLEDISATAAGPHDVERVECVRCNFISFHNSNNKYSAEVVAILNDRHVIEYYNNYANKWVKKFSKLTKTSWYLVARGGHNRLPFSRNYRCRQKNMCHIKYNVNSVLYAKISQNLFKLIGSRPECISQIIFKFSNSHKGSMITIVIDNYCKRLHALNYFRDLPSGNNYWTEKYLSNVAGPLRDCNDPLVTIDEVYYRYFADGHTYITAKIVHMLNLLCKYENNDNVVSDPTKNPIMSYVMCIYRLYKNFIKDDYVDLEVTKTRKQAEMEKLGGLMRFQSQDMVTIITPTMKRVLSSFELDEVIISSTSISQGPSVTLFFIPSKIGALCFACVLHKSQEAYSNIYLTIKSVIEEDYAIKFKPNCVVIVDESSTEQRTAAEVVFQNSKILIGPWSLCQRVWIWLCSRTSNKRYWHEVMQDFHKIMHAENTKLAHDIYLELMSRRHMVDFKDYFKEIWKQYKLIIWRSSANNTLVTLSIILLQQLFIQKCASFNIIHMCDIINILDKHFGQILVSWINKKQPVLKTYSKFMNKTELKMLKFELTEPGEFSIENKPLYKLRSDTWCCDCPNGRRALYCEHLGALMELADVTVALSEDEKRLFKHVAGETNDATADAVVNCEEANKVHPTYTDGYYLFYISTNINLQFTYKRKSIDLSLSGNESYIINDSIEKYISTGGVSKEVQDDEMTDKSATKSDVDEPVVDKGNENFVENIENFTELVSQKSLNSKTKCHDNNEQIEEKKKFGSVNIQTKDCQKSGNESVISFCSKPANKLFMNTETGNEETNFFEDDNNKKEKTQEQHAQSSNIAASLHHEVDLKMEVVSTEYGVDDKTLLQEIRSKTFVNAKDSESNFEAVYNNALENLRKEFEKFKDRVWLHPTSSKLESIVRLTKEFSQTRVEVLNVRSEPEDIKFDEPCRF